MKYIFFLTIISCLMASCSTAYYQPNVHQIPMHDSKGDATIMGSVGSALFGVTQFQMSADYALTDNWLVTANYTNVSIDNAKLGEVGGGYYGRDKNLYWQFLGSVGYGEANHTWDDSSPGLGMPTPEKIRYTESSAFRFHLTPAIGVESEYFAIALSTRFAQMRYFDITETLNGEPLDIELMLSENNNQFYIEPSLTVRIKYKSIALQSQLIYTTSLTPTSLPYENNLFSLGFIIDMDR